MSDENLTKEQQEALDALQKAVGDAFYLAWINEMCLDGWLRASQLQPVGEALIRASAVLGEGGMSCPTCGHLLEVYRRWFYCPACDIIRPGYQLQREYNETEPKA